MRIVNQRTEMVPIDRVRPHERNVNQGHIGLIGQSISHNGFYGSLVVQQSTGHILRGNHTWQAARQAGATEIPVTYVDVDDETALRILLVDNRATREGVDDSNALAALLQELAATPAGLEGSGYDGDALDELLADLGQMQPELRGDPDAVPAVPEEPVTKAGDIITLGQHRLLCGDSTSTADVGRLMAGQTARMVFTDPPYGVDYDGGTKPREHLANDVRGTDIYARTMPVLGEAVDPQAPLYLWHADRASMPVLFALEQAGYEVRAQIIWAKNQAQYGALSAQYKQKHEPCFYAHRRGQAPYWYGPTNEVTVWEEDRAPSNDFHPTQKPVALAERAITNSSRPGDLVLDLFGGSGSTLIGCESTGRRCYMMEIDPRYCDVIVQRWQALTGKQAVREPATAPAEASDHARVPAGA